MRPLPPLLAALFALVLAGTTLAQPFDVPDQMPKRLGLMPRHLDRMSSTAPGPDGFFSFNTNTSGATTEATLYGKWQLEEKTPQPVTFEFQRGGRLIIEQGGQSDPRFKFNFRILSGSTVELTAHFGTETNRTVATYKITEPMLELTIEGRPSHWKRVR
jgi:hypothetical protein